MFVKKFFSRVVFRIALAVGSEIKRQAGIKVILEKGFYEDRW